MESKKNKIKEHINAALILFTTEASADNNSRMNNCMGKVIMKFSECQKEVEEYYNDPSFKEPERINKSQVSIGNNNILVQ